MRSKVIIMRKNHNNERKSANYEKRLTHEITFNLIIMTFQHII